MRNFLLFLALLFYVGVCASEDTQRQAAATNEKPSNTRSETYDAALPVTINGPITIEKTEKERSEQREETSQSSANESLLVKWTAALVCVTALLVVITGVLAGYTYKLWKGADEASKRQAREMRESLAIARDATDATINTSIPVLAPFITKWNGLHQLKHPQGQITWEARIHVVFENYGKTPGMIREVRASLFLNEMDTFPVVNFAELPMHTYELIVPGNARKEEATAVIDLKQSFTLTAVEFSELLAEGEEPKYRRFALLGRVIYDDFFGFRHTRRFCIKMRLRPDARLFQTQRGGPEYNQITREKTPQNDLA